MDPMGGIVMTNDGNCILREVDVSHPAAKSMIELSRAQVGTSIHNNAVDTFNFTYIRMQEVYLTHTHTYIQYILKFLHHFRTRKWAMEPPLSSSLAVKSWP